MPRTSEFVGRYRWLICLLLFFGTSINYIDRQILSLLKPILDEQLKWTNEQYGSVNAAFQGSYALGLLLFGPFIDRYGTKIGYAVSITAWSLAALGHGFVGSVSGFFRARVLLGVSEGGNFPSAIKAVALWFPKSERALATALFNSGANVGAILAPAIVPFVAATWGWQSAFVLAGAAGLLFLLLWWPFYDVPEKARRLSGPELSHIRADIDEPSQSNEQARGGVATWLSLLRHRQAWSFIVCKLLTDPVWWFFLIWLPDYFKKTRGLDLKASWLHLVSIYSIVTVLSIVGGWLTGYLTKKGLTPTQARKTAMFAFAQCVLPILFVTKAGDWMAVVLIGVAGAAHQAWSANLFTTVSDMFPKRAVASVVGIGGMAGSLGGIAFPILAGKLLDHFQAAGDITAGYSILFGFCGFAYLLAFGISHALAPKFAQVTEAI
ncbi:MAG TPA: MFS transporter [Polyangiaceae bacterium]|nr:MFS transporter [Polyangiaceae bacterium]